MDIFGTTVTVIHEVYNITMFIRGVVADVKSREPDGQEIKDKLDHELLFLDSFKQLFFDDDGVLIYHDKLPDNLKRDIEIILSALRKTLAEYGMLAAKHGFLPSEGKDENETPPGNGNSLKTLHILIQSKAKELKKKTFDWALFDKQNLLKTLATYNEWTERLRQTMTLMLLTLSAFSRSSLQDFAVSTKARNLGIQKIAKRQLLAESDTPDGFTALQGHIVEGSEIGTSTNVRLATYENDWGGVQQVVIEYRNYDKELILATDYKLPITEELKSPIRNLAWLLHSSFSAEEQDDGLDTPEQAGFLTLPCLGYMDQPQEYRSLFLYKVPFTLTIASPNVITLHDLINERTLSKRPATKPSLGNRFFIAHTLASATFNIHSLGWVHKNIWSRGVVIFPSASASSSWLVPYITGWGIARSLQDNTALAMDTEVEPNFYRHPQRQGRPKSAFNVEHDIYALGVVLLEIGLWKSISVMFKKQIDQAVANNSLPEPDMVKIALVEKATADLASEMGESYARAIEKCLTGNFEGREQHKSRAALLVAFREAVVEEIAKGTKL